MYRTTWAVSGLVAALTLRHAIVRSGTNTLEGYFHPRQLSFALGALAIADFLRGRYTTMFLFPSIAGALHPTTGSWLAIWLGVALFIAERRLRPLLLGGAAACLLLAAWAFTAGPLSGRLAIMDDEWRATLSSKEYLFRCDGRQWRGWSTWVTCR